MPDVKPTAFGPFGEVWLGDLFWAIEKTTVGTREQRRDWALECLGLDLIDEIGESRQTNTTGDPDSRSEDMAEVEKELRRVPASTVELARKRQDFVPYGIVSSSSEADAGDDGTWLTNSEKLPALSDAQLVARPRLMPLFRPQTTRTLLSTALATCRDEGDIDIARVINDASRLRPLTSIPRLAISTLRFGIQLLIDRGPAMVPFYDDQDLLLQELVNVVGRDRVETLYFDDCPLRACGSGSRRGWSRSYEPPSEGTPSVLLTDLGIARERDLTVGAGPNEWLQFAGLLRGAGCPVLAILPYAEHRWPTQLRHGFSMIPWDRSTGVSRVRQLIGHGLEVTVER